MFKQDVFGHYIFIKRILIRTLGLISHQRYQGFNKLHIEGSELIRNLPDKKVLFISNHQTYFADVAAKETMRSGILPKIMAYAGAVPIERTWREAGKDINRKVKFSDINNIGKALKDGWVITFPQGTTKPFKPIRKGTAHIIKKYKPTVVPIVIDGFRRAYDKKGLMIKKRNVLQSMVIKEPLVIDYENDSVEKIVNQIELAIEQHKSFLKVTPVEVYAKEEAELNKKRNFWDMY